MLQKTLFLLYIDYKNYIINVKKLKYVKLFENFKKYFEELDFSRNHSDFTMVDSYDSLAEYLSMVDEIEYQIVFEKKFDNFWTRDYENAEHIGSGYSQTNKNPLKIVSAVTNVTEDFIKKYNPDAIIIYHINMINEICEIDKLNKRAKINYYYLKDIKEYNLVYYNQLTGNNNDRVRTTNCILYKKGIDISVEVFEKKLSSLFWDNSILVKP